VKRVLGAVLISGTTVLAGVQVAQAGGATDAALGLGAFAVFNQFVRGETIFHGFRPAPVVIQQPVVVAPPPVVYALGPPIVYAPPPPPVVYYALPPAVVYAPGPGPTYYARKYFHKRMPPGHYRQYYRYHRKDD
jgi:hypothetical protein